MTYVEPPGGDGNDPLAHCSFEPATLPSIQSGFDDVDVYVEVAASEKNDNVTRAFLSAQRNLHVLRIDKKPKRVRMTRTDDGPAVHHHQEVTAPRALLKATWFAWSKVAWLCHSSLILSHTRITAYRIADPDRSVPCTGTEPCPECRRTCRSRR
jgi:hypothetical protein